MSASNKLVIVLLSLIVNVYSLDAQTLYLGTHTQYGYSNRVNSTTYEASYEVKGKQAYRFGLNLAYQHKRHKFEMDVAYLSVGFRGKHFNGFTPSREFANIHDKPIYLFVSYEYDYYQLGFKYAYALSSDLYLGLGIHPSKIHKHAMLDLLYFYAKPSTGDDRRFGKYRTWYFEWEDYQPYNVFTSIDVEYNISQSVLLHLSYSFSVLRFNRINPLSPDQPVYHQAILAGLKYRYPLWKGKAKQ